MSASKNLNGKTLILTKIEEPSTKDQVDEAYVSAYTDNLIKEILAFETDRDMAIWSRNATSFNDLEVTVKTNKVFRDI